MLSYQHAYHAANAADIHKHSLLVAVLLGLRQRYGDKNFCVYDTHAGRGLYDLRDDAAHKTGELTHGLHAYAADPDAWQHVLADVWLDGLPAVDQTLAQVDTALRHANKLAPSAPLTSDNLGHYPGSAWLSRYALTSPPRMVVWERHPTELGHLRTALGDDGQIQIKAGDGLGGIAASFPPFEKRALVIIDPSYEVKSEPATIVRTLKQLDKTAKRAKTSLDIILWWPIWDAEYDDRNQQLRREMIQPLQSTFGDRAQISGLTFPSKPAHHRMAGSGVMWIRNSE